MSSDVPTGKNCESFDVTTCPVATLSFRGLLDISLIHGSLWVL
jgi:hypothetical protein